jgi:hypothetical protein
MVECRAAGHAKYKSAEGSGKEKEDKMEWCNI